MLRLDLLNMLQEQYELMTQIFACSSSSESNESQCSVRDEHLEVNKMQYFTFSQTGVFDMAVLVGLVFTDGVSSGFRTESGR